MKRTLLARAGFIFLLTPLVVTAQQFGDFTYSSYGGVITITGYTGPGGVVTIPAAITGLPVASIGDFAFYHKPSLTNITIPGSVTNIGVEAFTDCTSLASVTISASVISIGDAAFTGCSSLVAISVAAANTSYSSLDGV